MHGAFSVLTCCTGQKDHYFQALDGRPTRPLHKGHRFRRRGHQLQWQLTVLDQFNAQSILCEDLLYRPKVHYYQALDGWATTVRLVKGIGVSVAVIRLQWQLTVLDEFDAYADDMAV